MVVVIVTLLLVVRCSLINDDRPRKPGCVEALTVDCHE
jgi:hypothetical protein